MNSLIPAALLVLITLASCSRLDHVGRAPTLSEIGGPIQPVAYTVAPGRAALAEAQPQPIRQGNDRASLWNSGPTSLFGDRRASRRGDILTVLIEIDDQAQIQNSTARSRSGSENVGIPNLVGIPQILDRAILPEGASAAELADLSSSSSSSGDGSVRRNEQITLRIAATVVDVLPNGHLVVQGDQEVRVNFELRDLQIAGIVRPEDISRQNQITYDKIAGARISYGGRGQITDVQQPRYGQQIADILLPF
ncbi:flagellar basal body L-ring protein FlgH [Algicella marina]|uniref:Flagellar L-ring protein n=1 Tax=Algicella marina TaxID=2683284 RepID=A0A6P1T799_9RHOB|nr:flagellar basal body L-ring protein FlgH [Algicella marina]QHQ36452.1 flagellar basal body L-ring protein FlgH [Algicella marina]